MQRDKKKEYSVIYGQAACLRLTLRLNPNSQCTHGDHNNSVLAYLINAKVYGDGSRNICLPHHLPMASPLPEILAGTNGSRHASSCLQEKEVRTQILTQRPRSCWKPAADTA